MKIQYRDTKVIPRDQILSLYEANQWGSAKRPDELCKGLASSAALISAWDGDRLVGLGSAISDGHLAVYFPHLLVHPDYQRRGIGSEIVKRLQSGFEGFHHQMLVTVPEAIEFYKACGFKQPEGHVPMVVSSGPDSA
jgi:GNAT superfamily N-acetyltransferase